MRSLAMPSKSSIIFLLATLVPATILCFLAVGSLEKEAAFLEKQFRDSMQAEIHAYHREANVILINLHRTLYQELTPDTFDDLNASKAQDHIQINPATDALFLLSNDFQFVYPHDSTLTEQEASFLNWSRDFLNNKIKIPTYAQSFSEQRSTSENLVSVEELYFSEIVTYGKSGSVPFVINGKMHLIFWKKFKNDTVGGYLLNLDWLREKMLSIHPQAKTEERIFAVIDDNAKPLIALPNEAFRDWRQTFMAREISRALPNWKIATYLRNPKAISYQANRLYQVTGLVIYAMGFLIMFGGIFVIHSLSQRLNVAQQKASFAANVSHELKTPLTSIRLYTEMLLYQLEPMKDKHRQYLESVLSETNRLGKLINNVLDFTSLDKQKYKYHMKKVNVVDLCREAIKSQKIRLDWQGFIIRFNTAKDPIFVGADAEALKQPIINLLSNAEKYSGEHKEIYMDVYPEKQNVCIDVKDRGIGVKQDKAEKIFEEFYRVNERLDTKQQGTGLGLTIARKIVKDHKGSVTCHPQKEGVLFRITLPIYKGKNV